MTTSQQRREAFAFYCRVHILLVGLLLPLGITQVYFLSQAGQPAAWQQGVFAICKLVQFAWPVVWWRSRRWMTREADNIPGRARQVARSVLLGAGLGALVLALMGAIYYLWLKPNGFFASSLPAMQDKVRELGVHTAGAFLALAVFYCLVHSLLEEYYWRWFVFRASRDMLSLWPAIVVSSLGFMLHHVLVLGVYFGMDSPATWLFSLAVAVGGGMWAWLYEKYGTLLGPWVSHLIIDAAIFVIGYDLLFS